MTCSKHTSIHACIHQALPREKMKDSNVPQGKKNIQFGMENTDARRIIFTYACCREFFRGHVAETGMLNI